MTIKLSNILIATAFLAIAPNAQAQERQAKHDLGSATDVWRIELRNPELLLAMSAGDDDGVSELQKVEVKLTGTDGQMHAITESNPYIRVNNGPRKVGNTIDVRQGDRVKLDRVDATQPDTYNLWVHSKQRAQGDVSGPTLSFQITIDARELDCPGDRACGRGDNGITTYRFNMPVPTSRSLSCIPENRYRISAVNGATMRLSPLVRGGARGEETAAPQYSGSSTGLDVASGKVRGPHLALQSGEICIAATRDSPTLPKLSPEVVPGIPRNR